MPLADNTPSEVLPKLPRNVAVAGIILCSSILQLIEQDPKLAHLGPKIIEFANRIYRLTAR
jgi:hypothetical protein